VKGILRSALLFYTGGSVQVWMFAVAASLLVVNIVLRVVLPAIPPPFVMLLNVMGIVIATMAVFLGSINFRAAAAARALSFIPHARIRLGLGVLLAEATLAALAGAYVELTFRPPATSFLTTFVRTLALTNLWVVWVFLICGPSPWVRWGMVGVTLLSPLLIAMSGASAPEIPGVSGQTLLIIAATVVTLLFGTWYLLSRSISAPSQSGRAPPW